MRGRRRSRGRTEGSNGAREYMRGVGVRKSTTMSQRSDSKTVMEEGAFYA